MMISACTGACATLEMIHVDGHATIEVLEYPIVLTQKDKQDIRNITQDLSELSDDSLESLIARFACTFIVGDSGEYATFYSNMTKSLETSLIYDVFLNGVIDSDCTKQRLPDALHPYIAKSNRHAKQITHNLISSAALGDQKERHCTRDSFFSTGTLRS